MKKQLLGNLYLIVAVLIWGSTFVAQSVGMDSVGPFTFLAVRCLLAVVFLLPVIALFERKNLKDYFAKWKNKKLWIAGFFCGLSLFVASALQQMSLVDTDAGKAGFLTSLYVILVPVLGLFLGKKPTLNILISIFLAVAGLYLLSCVGVSAIRFSDLLLLFSALAFAVQIICVERLGSTVDGLRLNCIQCLVAGLFASLFMVFGEAPKMDAIFSCWLPLIYAGILSNGIAYTMQVLGQQRVEANTASIIMSCESVVAVLCGWLILNEQMTTWELWGCGLLFAAVILSQVSFKKK